MRQNKFQLGLLLFALLLFSTAVRAQDRADQVLQAQLAERDKVILELLQRVEALEKRVGVPRTGRRRNNTAKTGARAKPGATVKTAASGKATSAPGKVVVDARTAERALERSLSREGALLLGPGILEIEPSLSYARQENATPSFVATGGGFVAGQRERNLNRLSADLGLRLGLPWDTQLEIGLPYRWAQSETVTTVGFAPVAPSSGSAGGFGDLRIGVAKTLLREGLWRPDLVGRLTWNSDSGQSSKNGISLGGGFNELQASLTAIKRQEPMVFIGGLSYQHSFENNNVEPGAVLAGNLGAALALSPETSMRFFFSGAYQDEVELFGSPINGSDRALASFVIGGSTLLAPGVLLNLSLGIGLSEDADDFSLTLSLPIRFNSPIF